MKKIGYSHSIQWVIRILLVKVYLKELQLTEFYQMIDYCEKEEKNAVLLNVFSIEKYKIS